MTEREIEISLADKVDVSVDAVNLMEENEMKPIIDNVIDDVGKNILKEVKTRMGAIGVSPETITLLIKYVMEGVERSPMKGLEQKRLAMLVMRQLIMDALMKNNDEDFCLMMIDSGTVSDTIDLIVDATRGKLNINKVQNIVFGCFGACFKELTMRLKKQKTLE